MKKKIEYVTHHFYNYVHWLFTFFVYLCFCLECIFVWLLQVLSDAKRELRFLLVYLHGDDHQDTDNFCRHTLCHPLVINFLDMRLLFWACNTGSPEGYRGEAIVLNSTLKRNNCVCY